MAKSNAQFHWVPGTDRWMWSLVISCCVRVGKERSLPHRPLSSSGFEFQSIKKPQNTVRGKGKGRGQTNGAREPIDSQSDSHVRCEWRFNYKKSIIIFPTGGGRIDTIDNKAHYNWLIGNNWSIKCHKLITRSVVGSRVSSRIESPPI